MPLFESSKYTQLRHVEAEYVILLQLKVIRESLLDNGNEILKSYVFDLLWQLAEFHLERLNAEGEFVFIETNLPYDLMTSGLPHLKEEFLEGKTTSQLIDSTLNQFAKFKAGQAEDAVLGMKDILSLYVDEKANGYLYEANTAYNNYSFRKDIAIESLRAMAVVGVIAALSFIFLPVLPALSLVASLAIVVYKLSYEPNLALGQKAYRSRLDDIQKGTPLIHSDVIKKMMPQLPESAKAVTVTTGSDDEIGQDDTLHKVMSGFEKSSISKRFGQ